MESRYHMRTIDGQRFIEQKQTTLGRQFLEGLRKSRPDLFRGQRIKEVIQAYPSKITVGILHDYT